MSSNELPGRPKISLPTIDFAWLFLILGFLALSLVAPPQAKTSLTFTVDSLGSILPFLLASIALTAYAKASSADNMIAKAFSGHTCSMIIFAALMGVMSPFCSCGVIPLIAALLSMGVPLPAVMAFWLSSPLMDLPMFILTGGTLGWGFALYKTFSAFAMGILGGFGMLALKRGTWFANPLREGVGDGGCGGSVIRSPKTIYWQFWKEPARQQSFLRSARSNLLFLGKWLLIAYFLESLMLAYIPAHMITEQLGGQGWIAVILAVLLGIPAYLNGYAALPLVNGLIEQGMQPAAGMAFLLAGGVTSIPAALAVFAIARPPVFLTYLGFAVLGSLILGAGFALIS